MRYISFPSVAIILSLLLVGCLPLLAQPLAQDHVKVFHNADVESYVEGPGLVRMDDGALVAVIPIVPREEWSKERRVERSVVHVLRSLDGGRTWQELTTLPYYSAAPWVDHGTLYLFANKAGTKSRNDDLLLLKSNDGGTTWSAPVTLFTGHYWNCHTGMVQRDNMIYWAVDDLSLGKDRGPRLVAGDLSHDAMNPASWRISEPVKFPGAPDKLFNPKFANLPNQYLEPNVIDVNGNLRVLCAVKMKRPTVTNLCAVLDAGDDGANLDLKFAHYNSMPGGNLKFCVLWDEVSMMFWATSNQTADGQGAYDWASQAEQHGNFKPATFDRRTLMLHYSVDGLNWFTAGCVAQAAKLSQSFMYARPVIDGDDLAIICRSSINAPNQHDADYATFHRVKNFRKLALDLVPQPEVK